MNLLTIISTVKRVAEVTAWRQLLKRGRRAVHLPPCPLYAPTLTLTVHPIPRQNPF